MIPRRSDDDVEGPETPASQRVSGRSVPIVVVETDAGLMPFTSGRENVSLGFAQGLYGDVR